MYYIFDSSNKCVCSCEYEPDKKDLESRVEFYIESDQHWSIGCYYINGNIVEAAEIKSSQPKTKEEQELIARSLRNNLRDKIDKYLLPSSTIDDQLVTDSQKQTLIEDSLCLAKWPAQEGWPFINLPAISPLAASILGESMEYNY